MKHFPIPLPPPGKFNGQVCVVTGGTGGLGLAAAAHLVNLGAEEVIITSRNKERARQALVKLEQETHGLSKNVVRVLELDMNRYSSVVAFTEEVKKVRARKGGVDFVLLNAGLIGYEYKLAAEGWEQNIQVNVLSTVLIAFLLLPWMKSERVNRSGPSHLSIVGSEKHLDPNIKLWNTIITQGSKDGMLAYYNDPKKWPGPDGMYGITKLMVTYSSKTGVIVNTMCPGQVKTDLARHYAEASRAIAMILPVFMGIKGKTPENGARTLIVTGLTEEKENGKFIKFYGSEENYQKKADIIFGSETGRKVQNSLWSEIIRVLATKVPAVNEILAS
ncbi:NAD(P)-binding protein [Xylariaceae sp. FL0255]|nr:NAD(P)-binding protein [Xylariaceae sp. FL0255]